MFTLGNLQVSFTLAVGEQNQHGWFTPKRYKALGQYLEAARNAHPGTLPIKPQIKREMG